MRQTGTLKLFDYWNRLRGEASAPARAQIAPHAIARVLPHMFVLNADQHPPSFRLAGTWLCSAFGTEWTNRSFGSLFNRADNAIVQQLTAAVIDEARVAVVELRAQSKSGQFLDLEMILLPLSDCPERMVGAIHPATRPIWLGADYLEPVSITEFRVLDPEKSAFCLSNRPAIVVPARQQKPFGRRQLNVIDGSRRLTIPGKRPEHVPPLHIVQAAVPPNSDQ